MNPSSPNDRKDNKSYFPYGFLLLAVCVLSSAALSFVANMTAPAIEKTTSDNLNRLQKEVLPEADSFLEDDVSNGIKTGISSRNNLPVGKVVVNSVRGYGGDITVIVGISQPDNKVRGVKVLSHKETPGLGTKALTSDFLKQFISLKYDEITLKKDSPATGKIDGITGATITSRAVTKAVRDAVMKSYSQKSDTATIITPKSSSSPTASSGNYRIKTSSTTK